MSINFSTNRLISHLIHNTQFVVRPTNGIHLAHGTILNLVYENENHSKEFKIDVKAEISKSIVYFNLANP